MVKQRANDILGEASRLIHEGISTYRSRCTRLLVYGGVGSLAQATALLMLIPILRSISPADDPSYWQVPVAKLTSTTYWLYVLSIAALFALSVRMKYLNFSIAFHLSELFTVDCAKSAVRALWKNSAALPSSDQELRSLANDSLFKAPHACGILLRQFLLALNDILLVGALVAILFWLSPIATTAVLLLSIPPVVLYAQSYSNIARKADDASESRRQSSDEVKLVVNALRDKNTSDRDVTRIIQRLFSDGLTGQALSGQIQIRRQMRGSGALVELLTPIAIVVVAALVFFSDFLTLDLALILVYYLVLRQACAAAAQIADKLILVTQFHPGLRDYFVIVAGGLPSRTA